MKDILIPNIFFCSNIKVYIKIKLKFQIQEIINSTENPLPAFWFIRNNLVRSFSEQQKQSSDLKGLITKAEWVKTQKLGVTKNFTIKLQHQKWYHIRKDESYAVYK